MNPRQQVQWYSMPSEADVKRYSYAITNFIPTPAQLTQMKQWNPSLRVYAYRNFEATNNTSEYTDFKAKGWILRDSTGKDLQCTDITTEYLVDPGNVGYRAWLVSYCAARKAEGYDGVFADNFPRPRTPNKYRIGSKVIINPRTKVKYTSDEWVSDELATLTAVKAASPIIGNGIPQAHDETGYTANKARCDKIIASSIDGLMVEGPVAWSLADFNGRSEAVWKSNVDLMQLLLSSGKVIMFSNTGSADLETESVGGFVYCTYMMNSPTSVYSIKFRGATYMNQPYWKTFMEYDLGAQTKPCYKEPTGWFYASEYAGGKIRVDPTSKAYQIIIYPPPPPDPCQPYKNQITSLELIVQKQLDTIDDLNDKVLSLNGEVERLLQDAQESASQIDMLGMVIDGLKAKMDTARAALVY